MLQLLVHIFKNISYHRLVFIVNSCLNFIIDFIFSCCLESRGRTLVISIDINQSSLQFINLAVTVYIRLTINKMKMLHCSKKAVQAGQQAFGTAPAAVYK